MDDLFSDDRLQFFLRNHDDIKLWAAIESEVMAATRDLLGGAQALFHERLTAIDPSVVLGRHDTGPWERIIARHGGWPRALGLTLEWHRNVDPFGASPPKIGVFFWAESPDLVQVRSNFVAAVSGVGLETLGYKVPLEGVWPVGLHVPGSGEWWKDPAQWLDGILDKLVDAWPVVAPALDATLPGKSEASVG